MTMHMRHALARRFPILHRDVERLGLIDAFERALDALDCEEEVGDFGGGELGEVRFGGEGADEDVAGEQGFEVHEGEGVGGCVEDLPGEKGSAYRLFWG